MTKMILLALPPVLYNAKVFFMLAFCYCSSNEGHGYGSEIIDKLVEFMGQHDPWF